MGAFKKDVKKQYNPKAIMDKKQVDFHDLVQGHMVVAQYETKFFELSRYVLHMVAYDEEKAKTFQIGLVPYIYEKMTSF